MIESVSCPSTDLETVRPLERSTFPFSGFTPSLFATAMTSDANRAPLHPTAQYFASVPGIDRNTLKSGQEIIVRGYQSKDRLCRPACKANGRDVTFPDGRKLFMGSSGTGAPKDGSDTTEK